MWAVTTVSLLFAGLLYTNFNLFAKIFGINLHIVTFAIGLLTTIATYFYSEVKPEIAEWILLPFALLASLSWLRFSAGIIVDMINFLSTSFGLNKVLLGTTFLGVGNSLADLFANTSLSAMGYGIMACTGSVSGQMFNLLMSK